MGGEEEKWKRIMDFYEGGVKGEKGKEYKLTIGERIGLSDEVGVTLSRAVQDSISTATLVLDFSGIQGEERKFAEEMIGRGDQEAERTAIVLLAAQVRRQKEQMRQQAKRIKQDAEWRWVMLLVAIASPFVAVILSHLIR
ncbi:MAG: hypothetical protein WBH57_01655 [Anaerolineae bacterium]